MRSGRKQFGTKDSERLVVQLVKLKARVRRGGRKPSLASIASDLNSEGLRTQTGKLFSAQTVKNILARPETAKKLNRIKKTSLATADYLSKKQLRRLFAAARSIDDEMIIAVMVGSGLRASELCALQIRDLGIYGDKAQIDVRRGKGAKQRSVFISAELSKNLRTWLSGRSGAKKEVVFKNCRGDDLSYRTLYKKIKLIGKRAGLFDLHPHTLRHTFGTLLYHYQKDLFFVMEQLGHSKVDTTQIYAKTLNESKLEQMQAFGSDLSGLMKSAPDTDNPSKAEKKI